MSSNHQLILASNSPRREQLLLELGFLFTKFTLDIEESFSDDIEVNKIAHYLSQKKNKAYREHFGDEVIITADTTVLHGQQILEKPQNDIEAKLMLRSLSGHSHVVITGVTISDKEKSISFQEQTEVTFKTFLDDEISYYVKNYKPLDKAGAYGIQEWIGLIGVEQIKGSYFNVMGLPTVQVHRILTENFDIWPK